MVVSTKPQNGCGNYELLFKDTTYGIEILIKAQDEIDAANIKKVIDDALIAKAAEVE